MQVLSQKRIAFVFCPHLPETTRLYTMPFAAHIVRQLSISGWNLDIFLWSKPDPYYDIGFPSPNIHYNYIHIDPARDKIKFIESTLRFALYMAYSCVFSVGRMGSYLGGIVSAASRCPFVLLNDEFPSMYKQSRWLALERWGARRADVIVVPSDDRHATLREELQLDARKPFVTIRNTPDLMLPLLDIDWLTRMGIPRGKKIFIHAGSIADWAQVPEILASVSYWPKDAVCLLHNSRSQDEFVRYRRELSHLDNPARVFWNYDLLPDDKINSLISSCSGSFALYRNVGPNIEQIGTSSGKLMRSIVCGTPVITSSFASLTFVSKEGLGIQVKHPAEIPTAVDNLMRDRENYRERCTLFARSEKALKEKAWSEILQYVKSAPNGVDLFPGGLKRA